MVIRGVASFTAIKGVRREVGGINMNVTAGVFGVTESHRELGLGILPLDYDWRITEDGEVRVTEDAQPRQLHG
jgi:hypothetical protein